MKHILSRQILLPFMSIIIFMLSIVVFFAAWFVCNGSRWGNNQNPRISPAVEAIKKAIPSVVNISTEQIIGSSPNQHETTFTGTDGEIVRTQSQTRSYSLGSGCVISKTGIVLTNAHVVQCASKINVKLSDGRICQGRLFAEDRINDIALILLEKSPANLVEISCEYGTKPMLGESVIALGNPFGLDNSVTRGVISALDRKFTQEGNVVFSDIIQTDAVVYPGNSGGPLINQSGNMIGMNIAFHKSAHGISFAIPLPRIENVTAKWLIPEKTDNLSLGLIPGEMVSKSGDPEVVIAEILPSSPAEASGLRKGDIIRAIDGKKVHCLLELSRNLISVRENKKVSILLKSGKVISLIPVRMQSNDGFMLARQKLALDVHEIDSNLSNALGSPMNSGVIASNISKGNDNQITRGDIIFRIDDFVIHSVNDLANALSKYRTGDQVNITTLSFAKEDNKQKLTRKSIDFTIK